MSPTALTFNPEHTRVLDREVRRIDVHAGTLVVTETDNPEVLKAPDSFEGKDTASLTLYSPKGADVAVIYSDETPDIPDKGNVELDLREGEEAKKLAEDQNRPSGVDAAEAKIAQAKRLLETHFPEPKKKSAKKASKKEPRGDSGGSTGSFESRTVTELAKLAKERDLEVKGKKGKKPVKADFIKALRG